MSSGRATNANLDLAAHEQDATLTALAGALVALLNRARATDDEREQIVDMLVTLGFDDSGEQGSALDAIERGVDECRLVLEAAGVRP